MTLKAFSRLKVEGATHLYLLQVFDELAQEDPALLEKRVKDWMRNYQSQLNAEVDKAFGIGNPDKNALKRLKKLIATLNEAF